MGFLRSARSLAGASRADPIDWSAVTAAAISATPPGELTLTADERRAYRQDVRAARRAIRAETPLRFEIPDRVEIQDRHHWITANAGAFERLLAPIATQQPEQIPAGVRAINNTSMAAALSVLARHVLGQYDPILLADGEDHALYFVDPNIRRLATKLDVDRSLFQRWIAFHEVAHAAEFGAAQWLQPHLEQHVRRLIEALAAGHVDRAAMQDLHATMTAIEGYAELLMDRAFDEDASELRERLDARRNRSGPIKFLLDRFLGLGIKREQYERGSAFFRAVAEQRDLTAASAVWEDERALPTWEEFDDPATWLARVDP